MAICDSYILSLNNYIKELQGKGRQVRERVVLPDFPSQDIVRLSTESGASIVLRSDTFLELGGPNAGSYSITLYSDNPKLLQDGRITLIGPDMNESSSDTLPFGQVVIVGGEEMTDDDYYSMLQQQIGSEKIEGYMTKSTSESIWSRVSNEAAQKGFNFEALGTVIMRHIKAELPKSQSIEVLFITSSKEDVLDLHKIDAPVREMARSIKNRIWKARGVDITQCAPGGHCGQCSDKAACDEIKKVASGYHKSS